MKRPPETPPATAGRQQGRWKPGTSGNPRGRRPGTRNRSTAAAAALLEGEAKKLTRKAVKLALAGDVTALRLCLERIVPPARERPLPAIELPELASAADLPPAVAALVRCTAEGGLTASELGAFVGLLTGWARAHEVAELEARIAALETTQPARPGAPNYDEETTGAG